MQKKIPMLVFIVGLTISILQPAYAQMGMIELDSNQQSQKELDAHGEQIDEVLENVLTNHSANTISELDCNEVTDDEFERLGESWMGTMHPNPDIHERMDQMMGGEGSETLRAAHINMGKRYLGCTTQMKGRGWNGFMGMTSIGGMGTWGGMNAGLFGFHWILWLTTWVLGSVLLIVLIRYFWKKGGGKK